MAVLAFATAARGELGGGDGDLFVPSEYPTIQDAVDNAEDGDTIFVAPGVYDENVDVPVAVTIKGSGSGTDPLADTIIAPTTAGNGLTLHRPVDLQDLRVTGASAQGIRVEVSAPATVLAFDDVTWTNIASSGNGGRGVELHNGTQVSNMLVEDSEFDGNGGQGLRSASNVTFAGLRLEDCSFDGNQYGGYLQGTLDDVTIVRCTFNDSTAGYGVYTSETGPVTDLVVEDCEFKNNVVGLMIWNVQDNARITITGTEFSDNDRWGALIWGNTLTDVLLQGCSVLGNDVSAAGYYGLDFRTYGGPLDNVAVHESAIAGQTLGGGIKNRGWDDDTMLVEQGNVDASCNWWGAASGPAGFGPGSGDAVTDGVSFVPWLLSSDLDGPCLGGTPQGLKTLALADLSALLGAYEDDRRLQKAVAAVEKSLDPALWTSATTLAAKEGHKVFSEEKRAVVQLLKVKDDEVFYAEAQAAIEALADADEALSQIEIDGAVAGGGDAGYIAKAQAEMDKAAGYVAAGRPDKAIDRYKIAWKFALRAQ